jgi:hypothetical protein
MFPVATAAAEVVPFLSQKAETDCFDIQCSSTSKLLPKVPSSCLSACDLAKLLARLFQPNLTGHSADKSEYNNGLIAKLVSILLMWR